MMSRQVPTTLGEMPPGGRLSCRRAKITVGSARCARVVRMRKRLGPIFLKHVEDAIDERRAVLRDELAADGIMAASAELLPTSESSPHTCPSSSASYAGPGLVHSTKTGTTVTYMLSHPVVADLLTVGQVRAPRGHQRPNRVTDRTATDFADH